MSQFDVLLLWMGTLSLITKLASCTAIYILLDLFHEKDSAALADFNVVMTIQSKFVEVQGTS